MKLHHAALVCSSEQHSDSFFQRALGLQRTRDQMLPAIIGQQIFGRDESCKLIYYGNEHFQLEVFISPRAEFVDDKLTHLCLQLEDDQQLIGRCERMGIEVLRAKKGDRTIVFVKDFDGNLFEIKGNMPS